MSDDPPLLAPPLPLLLRRAASGDTAAFRALVEATQQIVYRVALASVGNAADAEDVVQETYVRAWQKIGSVKNAEAALGWLCAIARNVAIDRVRARKSRPVAFLDEQTQRTAIESLRSDAPDATARVDAQQTAAVVRGALAGIDEKFRLALILKDVEGMSAAEVAAVLDVPIGTVESRASRARSQLGKKLKKLVMRGKL